MTFWRILLATLLIGTVGRVRAAEVTTDLTPLGWGLTTPAPADAALDHHDPGLMVFTVHKPSDPYWKVMIGHTFDPAVPANERVRLAFQARSSTGNPMRAIIEHTVAPYDTVAQMTPTLGPNKWQDYAMDGVSPGYGPGGLAVRFQAGQQAGVIEIKNVHWIDLGLDPAAAAAEAAIQPAAIAARIEQYRKRGLVIQVVDAAGKPMAHATVRVQERESAFWFGCNLFELHLQRHDAAQEAYQQRFAALFNYATLPFYWSTYEPTPSHTQEKRLMAMADWCIAHGITPKGHPLVWQQAIPKWVPPDPDAAIPLLHARVSDLIQRFSGLVDVWDVVNEANAAANDPQTGVGAWVKRDGPAAVVATVLGWARAADPGHRDIFIYNDYDRTQTNLKLLEALQARHALPDVIGLQSHMHAENWRPEDVWETADRFAVFGKPIHFTETTVLSGRHRPIEADAPRATDWKTTPAGEAEQAKYVTQFYSILFSHPAVQAITWWDFSDQGAWLGAPAGLLRADMSPKPAYDALLKLIHHDWRTDVTLTSDAQGDCRVRAFCGTYTLDAAVGSQHGTAQITVPAITPGDTADDTVRVTLR